MESKEWQQFNIYQKMGNIGAEVNRAFLLKKKDKELALKSTSQALSLIDQTILSQISQKRYNAIREILLLREVFCDSFFGAGNFNVSPRSLKKYFLPFAVKANKG